MQAPFPPRDEWDVAAYPTDDCVEGYRSHRITDPPPGNNHSPGFRWGWCNARKDATGIDDGMEYIRGAFIQLSKRPN